MGVREGREEEGRQGQEREGLSRTRPSLGGNWRLCVLRFGTGGMGSDEDDMKFMFRRSNLMNIIIILNLWTF